MIKRQFLVLLAAISLFGCASSKITSIPAATPPSHQVKTIAIQPKAGAVTEAIAVEFSNKGFEVIDSPSMAKLLDRLAMSELDTGKPEGMSKLRAEGIDAYFTIRGVIAKDGRPINATARLTSLHTGKVLSAVTWENGWGGQAGSIADRNMRKGVTEAAAEIAGAVVKDIPQP